MIVPWTLVIWICEKSVFKHFKIRLNPFKWQNISGFCIGIKFRHQFTSVVPCRVIAKVFFNYLFCHIAFFLDKLINISINFVKMCNIGFDNPEPIVPAMEVALISTKKLTT